MKNKLTMLFLALLIVFPSVIGSCGLSKGRQINAVITVEFSVSENDQAPPKNFTADDEEVLKEVFGKGKGSLNNFIKANSLGKEEVESVLIKTVKINKTVDWFLPKYAYNFLTEEYDTVNPDGYDNLLYDENGNVSLNGKPSAERFYREQELIYLVTARAKATLKNSDEIKTLTVVPSKLNRTVEQNSLLWPHSAKHYHGDGDISSTYYVGDQAQTVKEAKLGNRSINNYILIPYAFIFDGEKTNITTLCHEYMHTLGAPDYYSYDGNEVVGVGEFDIMSNSKTDIPNLSLSYTRWKMGWLDEGVNLLPISQSGEYTLYNTDGENEVKAYKIVTEEGYKKGESFYIEYRKDGGEFSSHTASGLIIYRVNEENGYISASGEKGNLWKGNAYGEKEVYVFRFARELFGGNYEERNEITKNGICYATVGNKEGYKSFGNLEDGKNAITYSSGENSLIKITYLTENADGSVKFKVEMPTVEISNTLLKEEIKAKEGNRHDLVFDRAKREATAFIVCADKRIKNPSAKKLIDGKYGKVIRTSTQFVSARLPKYNGFERYVYLCYKDGDTVSAVKEFYIEGIKNVKLSTLIIISVSVGIVVPTVVGAVIKKTKKKKEKNNE